MIRKSVIWQFLLFQRMEILKEFQIKQGTANSLQKLRDGADITNIHSTHKCHNGRLGWPK